MSRQSFFGYFWPNLCAQTAIFQLPAKILTSPLFSDPDFLKESNNLTLTTFSCCDRDLYHMTRGVSQTAPNLGRTELHHPNTIVGGTDILCRF